MDDYNLPFWIYLAVVTVFVGGAMKKILASHLSAGPTLVAWLGATVLVERLWAFCLPAVLLLVLLAVVYCVRSNSGTGPPPGPPAQGKAVFITGKGRFVIGTRSLILIPAVSSLATGGPTEPNRTPHRSPSSNNAYWEQQHQQLLQSLPPALMEEYGEDYIAETKDLFQSFAEHANPDLSPVVDAIVHALLSPQPQARYYAGPGIGLMYFIHSYCPLSISNRFLQKLFVKKTLMPRALRKQSGLEANLSLNNNNDEKLQPL
uniref:Uncharacterized protein n=2 Tax=Poecilia mexicana TaxID=48701 RepID=A0A3B3Z4D3_9TELE